jgi:electron transport complex protein RnfB
MRRVTPDTIAVVDLTVCDRCGLCLPLCPPEAIHLELNILTVDDATCTGCEKCIAPCPVGALTMRGSREWGVVPTGAPERTTPHSPLPDAHA